MGLLEHAHTSKDKCQCQETAPIEIGDLKLYDVRRLARLLGFKEQTIRNMIRKGVLKARKISGKHWIPESSVRDLFELTD